MKFGMAMAARMPMMATTIISSISVNPCSVILIPFPPVEPVRKKGGTLCECPPVKRTFTKSLEVHVVDVIGRLAARVVGAHRAGGVHRGRIAARVGRDGPG